MQKNYIYLHGFASGPSSAKAQFFAEKFQQFNTRLSIPDLNQNDFAHLTLSRQLAQIEKILAEIDPAASITVIGSSFGGLTATYLAEYYPQVERLILLAPAFNFLAYWLSVLGEAKLQQWQKAGSLAVYHYIEKKEIFLNYDFIEDMYNHDESILRRELPTLIFHGVADTTIPIRISQQYAFLRPWVQLIELSDDHSLHNSLEYIWPIIQDFCQLSNNTN